MRALHRKLFRDLWEVKTQALAISLVMSCGVATFIMAMSTQYSLRHTRDEYYERHRFADAFASLKRAPNQLASRLAEIPGIAWVETRVTVGVTLDIPGMVEPAVGRLISMPDRSEPGLNRIYLRKGRLFDPERRGEVIVEESFALAHQLEPGAEVVAVINGRKQRLKVVGIGLSPEYIYAIRPGEMMPDSKRFGVFWMSYTQLAAAYDLQGAFNDLAFALSRGASEAEVLRRIDRIIEPYGGVGAYGRSDQLSHKLIDGELDQLRAMSILPPTLFLSVAAFLLNVVLTRLIHLQREQIAVLKAFGYSKREIGFHYLQFVLVLVVIGAIVGTAAGYGLGWNMTQMYADFFRFPVYEFSVPLEIILGAIFLSGTASVFGTLTAVRRAVNLPPAEAMRPEPPAKFRPTLIERLGFQRFLSPAGRMIVRRIGREPLRALFTVLGIAMATAVLVLGSFVSDTIDYVIEFQFHRAQRQDVTLTFVEPSSSRVLHEVAHLPGVHRVEPFRSVAVRLRHGPHSRRLGVMGIVPRAELFRLLNGDGREIVLPEEGMVVSKTLGDLIGLKPGDVVTLEVLEGERPVREAKIVEMIEDFGAPALYMDIHALHRLLGESDVLSGAYLAVDSEALPRLYERVKETPRIAGITVKLAAMETFQRIIAENLLQMRMMNVIFAMIIAFGVVYNSGRIALSERSRELATLRVIGFTRGEIAGILLGELAVLTLIAIPLGFLFGTGLAWLAVVSLDTENQRVPMVIELHTYAFAAAVTLSAAVITAIVVRRLLNRLDLVAVLKSRE